MRYVRGGGLYLSEEKEPLYTDLAEKADWGWVWEERDAARKGLLDNWPGGPSRDTLGVGQVEGWCARGDSLYDIEGQVSGVGTRRAAWR